MHPELGCKYTATQRACAEEGLSSFSDLRHQIQHEIIATIACKILYLVSPDPPFAFWHIVRYLEGCLC